MIKKLLFGILLVTSVYTFAQDQKWSVEANYPFNLTTNKAISSLNGVIDLGIKYRFLDLGPVNLGVGINGSLLKNYDKFTYGNGNNNSVESDYRAKTFLLQPKIFAELAIPGIPKLKPQLALGYSVVIDDQYYKNDDTIIYDDIVSDGGLNLNLGLSYDISKRFFVQVQYDYINIFRKGESVFEGQTYTFDFKEDASILKAGVGFRF